MKKLRFIITLAVTAVMLCSCQVTSFDTDGLLIPPQMDSTNSELLSGISSAIGGAYELLYPVGGNYQTAIVSIDLTSNEQDEAVCFYSAGTERKASILVLEKLNGKWELMGNFQGQANGIDRVEFADINKDGVKEIIVGWKYLSGEEKALEILSLNSSEVKSEYAGMYNSFTVFEDCVVTVSKNTSGKTASAALIGNKLSGISILGTVSLNNSISAFVSIKSGQNTSGKQSIFIDEQLESLLYTTEILTVSNGELTITPVELCAQTTRTRATVCTDIDGDGFIDVPTEQLLPEYERNGKTENLMYIDWKAYNGTDFEYINSGYVSTNEQFFLEFPKSWIGHITIQRDSEIERAIHFYFITDGKLQPMFSVRVFSQQEYNETVQHLGWLSIETSNENIYVYRSDMGELPVDFQTDIETIKENFKLIS